MNYKIAAAALTLAAAFGSAGCSRHGNNQQAGPASNASTQLPQTPATAPQPAATAPSAGMTSGAAGAATAGMAAAGAASAGAPPKSFDDLAGSKGYITRPDAQRDSWLASHFGRCDTNHDGKLSRQEYTQCMQMRGGAMTPEGVPSSASSVH